MSSRGKYLVSLVAEKASSNDEDDTGLQQALTHSPIFFENNVGPGYEEVEPSELWSFNKILLTNPDELIIVSASESIENIETIDGDILPIQDTSEYEDTQQMGSLGDDFLKEKENDSLFLNVNLSNTVATDEAERTQTDVGKNISPGRKRYRNPQNWKVQEAKRKRNAGQEYTSYSTKKTVKAREMKESCEKKKCRMKCYLKIVEEQRRVIFQKFWKLGDHNKHMDFLAKHVRREQKKVETIREKNSRRQFTMNYYFTVGESITKVCKTFFLNTLDITDIWIRTVMLKLDKNEIGIGSPDSRGKVTSKDPKLERTRQFIREHIESLPTTESHYIRRDSKRQYLQVDIQSVNQMYRLYIDWAKERKFPIATCRQYRYVFEHEYNIGFFLPKKDQCELCDKYLLADENKKEKLETEKRKHQENKEAVRKLKETDKQHAKDDKSFNVACYDLQKILVTPYKDVSIFYYKLKYSTYNLTLFDVGNNKAYCYVWHETIAKRGANEIGSFVLDYIKNRKQNGVDTFVFYTDNCAGQNRNRFVFAMYVYAVERYKISITHRFLEKGHTQNEGDSVHALIERQKKGKVIYTPEQWIMLIKMAKVTGEPYEVIEVSQDIVYDLKQLVGNDRNWKTDENGKSVRWNDIGEIHISCEEPHRIEIKYDFIDENEKCLLDLNKSSKNRRIKIKPACVSKDLVKAYKSLIPISNKKYDHLQYLCKNGIPEMYHNFFKNLPRGANGEIEDDED